MGSYNGEYMGIRIAAEYRKYVEKMIEYIGWDMSDLFWGDGDPGMPHCDVEAQMEYVNEHFYGFGHEDFLYLLNALFPNVSLIHHTSYLCTSDDCYEYVDKIYDPNTCTCTIERAIDSFDFPGVKGKATWKTRFVMQAPEEEFVQALLDKSVEDGNTELSAMLLELTKKLKEGSVVYQEDESDKRVVDEPYDVSIECDNDWGFEWVNLDKLTYEDYYMHEEDEEWDEEEEDDDEDDEDDEWDDEDDDEDDE